LYGRSHNELAGKRAKVGRKTKCEGYPECDGVFHKTELVWGRTL